MLDQLDIVGYTQCCQIVCVKLIRVVIDDNDLNIFYPLRPDRIQRVGQVKYFIEKRNDNGQHLAMTGTPKPGRQGVSESGGRGGSGGHLKVGRLICCSIAFGKHRQGRANKDQQQQCDFYNLRPQKVISVYEPASILASKILLVDHIDATKDCGLFLDERRLVLIVVFSKY